MLAPRHAHLLAHGRLVHSGPGRARRHRGSNQSPGRTSAALTPTICGCASAGGTSGTSRSAASRAGRSFTSAWRLDQNTFERQGAVGHGDVVQSRVLRVDGQPVPAGGRGRQHGVSLLSAAVSALRGCWAWRGASAAAGLRDPSGGDPRSRLAQAQRRRRVPACGESASGEIHTETTQKGVGGAVQFVFLPHLEFGLNAAQGTIWSIDERRTPAMPRGASRGPAWAGSQRLQRQRQASVHVRHRRRFTPFTKIRTRRSATAWWTSTGSCQNFVAVQYVVFQQLYIKLVGGYARGHWITADDDPPIVYDDEMYSLRLRFSFYF